MNGLDFSKLTIKNISLVISVKGMAGSVTPPAEQSRRVFAAPRKQHGILLVRKGKTRYVFQNQSVLETAPGALVYLPKDSKYFVETIEDMEGICVNFDVLEDINCAPWTYQPKNYAHWEELCESILRLWRYPAPGYNARCKSILYSMLASIEEEQQAKYFPKDKKERIENAILKMEEEFRKGNNVDIPFLAEQCNVSQTYFRRLFHSLYGASPKQYILSVRLRWAKTMLKSTEDSITEIAKNCGFDNVYYFSRAFRIHEGVCPSEYRNHHKETITEKRKMDNKAILMDIKRFAVHDGPGLRTTVFLKGCTLKCVWCHNPEGISRKNQLAYYEHKCIGCGECVNICPQNAHTVSDGKHNLARENCIACGICESACLGNALTLFGREIDVSEAYRIATEDAIFYRETGGVTVSGGEPLLYSAFIKELFTKLKADGIHTAVDTCGNIPWENFSEVLSVTDLFLYDIKHINSEAHKKLTGADNNRILDNLQKLSDFGAKIEIRMPLVPGANDDEKTLHGIGAFLKNINISRMKVLPYHSMARSKYTALGMNDTMPDVPSPTNEELKRAVDIFKSYGINAVSATE